MISLTVRLIVMPIVVLAACSVCFGTAPLTYPQFADCISQNFAGYDSDCILQSGIYVVDGASVQPLSIGRSNITIEGAWPYPTLQRALGFTSSLMFSAGSNGVCPGAALATTPCFVQIKNLTFDGNRYAGATAPSSEELDLAGCQYCTVNLCTFNNSPNFSLYAHTDSPTDVRWSTFNHFKAGGIYAGPDSGSVCPSPSYWSSGLCLSVGLDIFSQGGVGAIGPTVKNGSLKYNIFDGNHGECIYGAPGGQIDLDQFSDSVSVQLNVFENGPSCANGYWADGVEIHGSNISLFNNIIKYNAGNGIYIESGQNITIGSDNPSAYPIEYNNQKGSGSPACATGFEGISIHSSSVSRTASNISVSNIWSIDGHSYGVQLSSCGTGSLTGSPMTGITITGNCLSGNHYGGVNIVSNCGPNHNQSCLGTPNNIGNNQTSSCGGN